MPIAYGNELITNEEIEAVARALCKGRGVAPDDLATRNSLLKFGDLIIPPKPEHCLPAWTFFRQDAVEAILAVRKFASQS